MKYLLSCCMVALVALIGVSCVDNSESGNTESDNGVTVVSAVGTCDLGVVLLMDRSGSMDNPAEDPLIDRVKGAVKSAVQNVESGSWAAAFETFEEGDMPPPVWPAAWELEILTDANRADLISAIGSITAAGTSDIKDALWSASNMLALSDRKPVIVIFSDGEFCTYASCDDVLILADILKSQGTTIVTVGYGLDATAQDKMKSVASARPGTNPPEPLFIHPDNADDLANQLEQTLLNLCDLVLEVQIVAGPPFQRIGSGGTSSGDYTAEYVAGDGKTVALELAGSFISNGGLFSCNVLGGELSPTSQSFGSKYTIRAASTMDGSYTLTLRLVEEGLGYALASKSISIDVVPVTIHVAEESAPHYDATTDFIEGSFKITGNSQEPIDLSINSQINVVGAGGQASGFGYVSGNHLLPLGSGPINLITGYKFKRNGATPGDYKVVSRIIGLGVTVKSESSPLTIP